jgi:MraZ protein
MYVAPESDQTLGLFSEAAFRQRANRLEALSGPPGHVKNYMRLYYAQAELVEVDAQGRIRIPERLIAFAGLQEAVVLLGVHDHVEIWDQAAWDQFLATRGAEFDELASRAWT